MAEVIKTDSMVITKFNAFNKLEIMIEDRKGKSIILLDNDSRKLLKTLKKWVEQLEEE